MGAWEEFRLKFLTHLHWDKSNEHSASGVYLYYTSGLRFLCWAPEVHLSASYFILKHLM